MAFRIQFSVNSSEFCVEHSSNPTIWYMQLYEDIHLLWYQMTFITLIWGCGMRSVSHCPFSKVLGTLLLPWYYPHNANLKLCILPPSSSPVYHYYNHHTHTLWLNEHFAAWYIHILLNKFNNMSFWRFVLICRLQKSPEECTSHCQETHLLVFVKICGRSTGSGHRMWMILSKFSVLRDHWRGR